MRIVKERFTQSNLEEVVVRYLNLHPQWIHIKLVGSDPKSISHVVDALWKRFPKAGITGHYIIDNEANHGKITFLALENGEIRVQRVQSGDSLPEGTHFLFAGEGFVFPEFDRYSTIAGGVSISRTQRYAYFDANGFLSHGEALQVSFFSPTFLSKTDILPLWQLHVPWKDVEMSGNELISIDGKLPLEYMQEFFQLSDQKAIENRIRHVPIVRKKQGEKHAIPLPIKGITSRGTIELFVPIQKDEEEEWGWGIFQSNLWDQMEWIKSLRSKGTQFLASFIPTTYQTFALLRALRCFPVLSFPFDFQILKRNGELLVTTHEPIVVALTEDPFYRIELSNDLLETIDATGELALLNYEASLLEKEKREKQDFNLSDVIPSESDSTHDKQDSLQEGKLAELGFLTATILHELNTPLAAIHSAITNTQANLIDTFKLISFLSRELDEELLGLFYRFGEFLLKNQKYVSSREERKLKKELTSRLEAYRIQNAEMIARELAKTGTEIPVMEFEVLLKHPRAQWLIDAATRLTRLQLNFQNIQTASEKMVTILSSAKRYLHEGDSKEESVVFDLIQTIEDALQLYHGLLKRSIEIERNYPQLSVYVSGNPSRLTQVWTNLIQNAIHAMNESGIIKIQVEMKEDRVVVSITDTGEGIPDNIKSQIFQPFFTTKKAGKGTGLGLPICKEIVEEHGGTIEFTSQPGKTTFFITLPVVDSEAVTFQVK